MKEHKTVASALKQLAVDFAMIKWRRIQASELAYAHRLPLVVSQFFQFQKERIRERKKKRERRKSLAAGLTRRLEVEKKKKKKREQGEEEAATTTTAVAVGRALPRALH